MPLFEVKSMTAQNHRRFDCYNDNIVKKKTFSIYVFRHGQTTYNRDERFTGFIDAKLTKLGMWHAEVAAMSLKDKKFEIAFQTSLSRSQETLDIVLQSHPECTRIIEDDRMIERDYGTLSGRTHKSVILQYDLGHYEEWHRGFGERPPRGESFADVEVRVRSFIKDLTALIRKERVNVAISAHGNSIRLFRKIMERATRNEACSWFIPYDKVFTYRVQL